MSEELKSEVQKALDHITKDRMALAVNGALCGFTEAIIALIDSKSVYCLEDIKNLVINYQKTPYTLKQ